MPSQLQQAWTEWNWAPSILLGMALFVGGYLAATGPLRSHFKDSQPVSRGQKAWFLAGSALILFALISPLDEVGDSFLFSAHMIQHLLIALIAPPLLLIGTPGWLIRPVISKPLAGNVFRFLTLPVVAFFLGNGVYLAWHFPALYEAALNNENVHIIEHLSFIAAGVINWWPVLSPLPDFNKLPPLARVVYLFLDGLPTTILSALITFSTTPLYPTYAAAGKLLGIDAVMDQQAAGMIMWMPGGMTYLVALTIVFFKWQSEEEKLDKTRNVDSPVPGR
ncbi:MAG: cytochrome c oxidase assembly protein [Omnitrophica WOR_2 bacterium]